MASSSVLLDQLNADAAAAEEALKSATPSTPVSTEEDAARADRFLHFASSTPEQLQQTKGFRPEAFFNEFKDTLTTEDVQKLAETKRLKTTSLAPSAGEIREGAEGLASAVTGILGGAWRAAKTLPKYGALPLAGRLIPGGAEGVGEAAVKDAAEAGAGFEQSSFGLANLARTGVRKIVQDPGGVGKLIEATTGIPAPRIKGDIANKGFFEAEDWVDRLVRDAAVEEQTRTIGEGKGEALKFLGVDAASVEKKYGVKLDPEAIADWANIADPTLPLSMMPAFGAVKIFSGPRLLGTATSKAAAETFIEKLGSKLTKVGAATRTAGEYVSVPGGATAGGVLGATMGTMPGGALVGASLPAGLKVSGVVMQRAGKAFGKYGKLTLPAVEFMGERAKNAVEGGAMVAPLAAASDYFEDEAAQAGTGAVLAGLGGATHDAAKVAKKVSIQAAEAAAAAGFAPSKTDAGTVRSPDYGTDATLDKAHSEQMSVLEATDPDTAGMFSKLRTGFANLGKKLLGEKHSVEMYLLPEDEFFNRVKEDWRAAVGEEAWAKLVDEKGNLKDPNALPQGMTKTSGQKTFVSDPRQGPNGETVHRVYVRLDGVGSGKATAMYHEPGHLAQQLLMTPDERAAWFAELEKAHTPAQLDAASKAYSEDLGGGKLSKEQVLEELGSEYFSILLRTGSLEGAPIGLRRQAARYASRLAESVGLYRPDAAAGTNAGGVVSEGLGVKASPKALSAADTWLRGAADGVETSPQPPVLGKATEPPVLDKLAVAPEPAKPVTPAAPEAAPAVSNSPLDLFLQGLPPDEATTIREVLAKRDAGTPLTPEEGFIAQQVDSALSRVAAVAADATPVAKPADIQTDTAPAQPQEAPARTGPLAPDRARDIEADNLRGTKQAVRDYETPPKTEDTQGFSSLSKAVNESDLPGNTKRAFNVLHNVAVSDEPHVVEVAYHSAAADGKPTERTKRRGEIEAARGLTGDEKGDVVQKNVIPLAAKDSSSGPQILCFSPDKVLSSVSRVMQRVAAKAPKLLAEIPYRFDKATNQLTPEATTKLRRDLEVYLRNQSKGLRGDGQPLVVPEGYEGYIPEAAAGVKGESLGAKESDFLNLLMGIHPPATNKVFKDAATGATKTPANVRAQTLAEANKRPLLDVGSIKPANTKKQTYTEFGRSIKEMNPLRQKLEKAGVAVREVIESTEWINVRDLVDAAPRPANPLRASVTDVVAAGFLPAERLITRAVSPDKDLESTKGYVYHATNRERALDIAESGRVALYKPWFGTDQSSWPDGSTRSRSYWSPNAGTVWHFAPEEGRSVVLRTKVSDKFARESTGDMYTETPLPAAEVEILTDKGWESLSTTRAAFLPAEKRVASVLEMKPEDFREGMLSGELKGVHAAIGVAIRGDAEGKLRQLVEQGRDVALQASAAAMQAGDLDRAFNEATRAQWFRESLEAADNTTSFMPAQPVQFKRDEPLAGSVKKPIRIVHYSSNGGLTRLDPAFFGKGSATPSDLRGGRKIFTFVEGSRTQADSRLTNGTFAYGATVDGGSIYDMSRDPLDVMSDINVERRDSTLKKAGYAGFYIPTYDGRRVVALYEPLQVDLLGKSKKEAKVAGRGIDGDPAARFMPKPRKPQPPSLDRKEWEKALAGNAKSYNLGWNQSFHDPKFWPVPRMDEGGKYKATPEGIRKGYEDALGTSNTYWELSRAAAAFLPGEAKQGKPYTAQTSAGKDLQKNGADLRVEDYGTGSWRFFLYDKSGQDIGYIETHLTDPATANVGSVWVNKEYRNQGIAESLYREAATVLQRAGVTKLTGDVVTPTVLRIREKVIGPLDVQGLSDQIREFGGVHVEQGIDPAARFLPPDRDFELVAAATRKNKGATYNVKQEKLLRPGKDKAFIVSLYPELTERIPEAEFSGEHVKAFAEKHAGMLDNDDLSVGTWSNEGDVWLDVSLATPKKAFAEFVAQRANQKALYDLKNEAEVPTFGTGEIVNGLPPVERRLSALAEEFEAATVTPEIGIEGAESAAPLAKRNIRTLSGEELAELFPEIVVPEVGVTETGKRKVTTVEYGFADAPLVKGLSHDAAVKKYAAALVKEAQKWMGTPEWAHGAKWYSQLVPKIKEIFGEHSQLFAELLAATSPRNNPEVNFQFTEQAFEGWLRGEYNKQIDLCQQGLAMLDSGALLKEYRASVHPKLQKPTPSAAELLGFWIEEKNLIPTQWRKEDTKYGTHGLRILQVLSRRWMEANQGPKTEQFVGNLTGKSHGATVDVWAARTLRRLGYEVKGNKRWRLLPEQEGPVSDRDFAFGQEVFAAAAKELGMRPDSLQGAMWFAEKRHWSNKGWGRLDYGSFARELKRFLARRGQRDMEFVVQRPDQAKVRAEDIKALPRRTQELLFQ